MARHSPGATLDVTEKQPSPPCARKAGAVASSPAALRGFRPFAEDDGLSDLCEGVIVPSSGLGPRKVLVRLDYFGRFVTPPAASKISACLLRNSCRRHVFKQNQRRRPARRCGSRGSGLAQSAQS